uniref:Titin n=1 Tax=Electrophorus electricus TaxID=8005 RepID=A0AAY5EL21_ELEEL
MAVNKYGVGEPLESDPTIADNPYVPPDPPQTPEITAVTKDSLVLCWGAPANNGGSEITNYGIERRDRLSFRWVKCNKQKVTDLHFKVTGLVPGHEYEFRVTAENAAGVSLPSPSTPYVKATDTLFKPGPPGNPRILDTTSSSITLAWNKPVYDGGSAITGYIVETCLPGTDEEQWTIVSPKDGLKGTSFTIINLKKNQEYKINVSAVNNEGIGEAASVPGSPKAEERLLPPEIDLDADLRKVVNIRACNTLRLFVLIRGRPSPEVKWSRENDEPLDRATIESTSSFTSLIVGNVNRFDSGKYNLTVENNSGSKTASVMVRIKNYIVEKREATRKAYATINANCHKTSWTVDQLQEGCNYYFRVLAENEYGIGLPIETIESVKVSEKPLPPGKITLQDVTKTSVTLSWEKPEHDGGSRVVAYVVEVQSKGSEKWTQAVVVKETEAVISGLTHGEEYMFRVSARNEKGTSEPRQLGVPVIVKDLVITPSAKLLFSTFSVLAGEDLTIDIPYIARPQAAVSWVKDAAPLKRTTRVNFSSTETQLNLVIKEACRDDVGKYSIKLSNTAGETSVDIGVVVLDKPGPPTGPVKVEEVTADTDKKYEFHVIARNAAGVFSLPSYSTGPITAKDEIEPPRISIDPQYTQTIIVNAGETFKIDADVHGKPVPTIYWMKGDQELGNTIYREIKNTDNFACLSVKEAKLADSGQYTLLLKNPGGEKAVHVNVSVLDKPGAPEGPIFITVSNVKKDSMVLSWEAPTSNGGTPITGYIIEKHDKEGVRWTRCNRKTVTDLTFKVTGLLEGHLYEFRVAAENAVGVSEPSSSTVFYKALDPVFKPGPPHNPKLTDTTKSSVSLAWGKPIYDGGCEIQGYIVESCEVKSSQEGEAAEGVISEVWAILEKLKEKQEYKFRVCAVNKVGIGEHADVAGHIVPEDKTEEPDLDIDLEFRKLVSIKAGGSLRIFIPIRGRPQPQIKWEKDEGSIKETAQIEVTSSHTMLVVDKVNRSDSGKYTVFAENSSGVKSATISVKVLDTPSAPNNLKVQEITKESVTLSWEPPALDGGAKIKNYIVEKPSFTNVIETHFTVSGLTEGNKYDFRVFAKNAVGTISKPSYNSGPIAALDEVQPPKFSIDPEYTQTLIVNAGDSFKLDADVHGKPVPTIQWLKGDKEIENTIRLKVLDKPSTPEGPLHVTGLLSDRCTLSWRPPQ